MREKRRPKTWTCPLRRGYLLMLLAVLLLAYGLVFAGRGCRSTGTQPNAPRPDAPEAPPWAPEGADPRVARPASSASPPDSSLVPPYSAQPNQEPADKGPADLGLPIDIVIKDVPEVPEVPEKIARPSPPIEESP